MNEDDGAQFMRPLSLNLSALSAAEYDLYTASLDYLATDSTNGNSNSNIRRTTHVRDDARCERMSVGVREARAWLRGRFSDLPGSDIEAILKLFCPNMLFSDKLTGGQFFAALRLVIHADSGKGIDPTLAFVQDIASPKPAGVPRKRTLAEAGLTWFKSAKFTKLSPSSITASRYRSIQCEADERLLDDRANVDAQGGDEIPDNEVPPIPLVYQPFGVFSDVYLHTGHEKGACPRLEKQVDEFATQMTLFYPDEDRRRDAVLPLLNNIFREALGGGHEPITPAITVGKCATDGHNVGACDIPRFLVEFENEMAGINSIPILELCAYYHQLITKVDVKILLSSKMPTLGMTIIGSMVTFYAIVFVGRYHYTTLTSGLSCAHRASNENDRQKLYDAFAAAVALLHHITQDTDAYLEKDGRALPPQLRSHLYPAITELPSFEDSSKPITFEITRSIVTTIGRYVYLAISSNGDRLAVKFTRSYSPELHSFCAEKGHAPMLRGFAKLPGGFFAVAMDFVDGDDLDSVTMTSLDDLKHWANQLTDLINSFHAADYVHGDIRSPNILVTNNKVMLLDFDWAGKEGDVFYPRGRLALELTEGRTRSDQMITKVDDRRILATLLKKMGLP